MKSLAMLISLSLAFLMCALAGCRPSGANYRVDPPGGFAVYTGDTDSFRSISSDGVRIRIRRVDNNPRGDAAMWGQALATYLTDRGYHGISEEKIVSRDGREGVFAEYAYWFNAEEYRYAITIFTGPDHLYIIETGGTVEGFARKRDGILDSLRTFRAE